MPRTSKYTLPQVIQTTLELVDGSGMENLSLHAIAKELQIKTPSLYSYFTSLDDLKLLLSSQVHIELYNFISDSMRGVESKDVLHAFAYGYRKYAYSYPERYKLSLFFPKSRVGDVTIPFWALRDLLNDSIRENFGINEKDTPLLARAFRSQLHGFISLELCGGWSTIAEADETFRYGVDLIIDHIKRKSGVNKI